MEDCLFCKIGRGEIPAKRVHEDALCFAFEDISPQAPTHVLVCPKQHVASLAEAGPGEEPLLGHLLAAAARIARERRLSAFRAVVNTGRAAGQSVFHVHVHLLGGRPMEWPPG